MPSLKKFENLHIGLWLLKDICWMMEFKILGVIMILPTITMAVYILVRYSKSHDLYINLAVLCWILANSTWMILEFFTLAPKYYGLPFFIIGILSFLTYFYKTKGALK